MTLVKTFRQLLVVLWLLFHTRRRDDAVAENGKGLTAVPDGMGRPLVHFLEALVESLDRCRCCCCGWGFANLGGPLGT